MEATTTTDNTSNQKTNSFRCNNNMNQPSTDSLLESKRLKIYEL